MDLLCINFTKVDPSKSGKENILVLTDAFTKFSLGFVTPNQKALTIAKILVDKWFYVYGILHKYIVTKAGPLIIKSCNICMLCAVLSSPQTCHTTCVAMLNANSSTVQ